MLHSLLAPSATPWEHNSLSSEALIEALWSQRTTAFGPDRVGQRAVWVLDRLSPTTGAMGEQAAERFRTLWEHTEGKTQSWALFAWGRRLRRGKRRELFEIDAPTGTSHVAAQSAWCDSCDDGELDSLLDWYFQCRAHRWRPEGHWDLLPFEEYCHRSSPEDRRERLPGFVAELTAAAHLRHRLSWPYDALPLRSLRQLLLDAAAQLPPQRPEPTSSAAALQRELCDHGHDVVAEVCEAVLGTPEGQRSVGMLHNLLWDARTRNIEGTAFGCCAPEPEVIDRWASALPTDAIVDWMPLLRDGSPQSHIVAFCKWLRPEFRDGLIPHFRHSDPDWSACAFQSYLRKAPDASVQPWRGSSHFIASAPLWQIQILDRHCFAPEPLRPPAVVYGTERCLADMRLQDPLSVRGI